MRKGKKQNNGKEGFFSQRNEMVTGWVKNNNKIMKN